MGEEPSGLDFENMYLHARSWGIQPSEFWAMTMGEWLAEYEFHADQSGVGTYAGKLTQGVVDDLLDDMELSNEEWWQKHGSSEN